MDLEVGQVIADRYSINRLVGRGCLGHVYEARDSARGGRVAIRVLDPDLDTDQVAAFNDKEAKATGRLGNDHVNELVRIEFLLSGERCIVSPFVDGEALQRILQRRGALPSDAVVALLAQVLDGLAAAHAVGVVHRDLTPRSILIAPSSSTSGAVAKIIDFGISRIQALRTSSADSNQWFEHDESFRYLPPEQLEGSRELDARSNVYSLGILAFHALTGRLPDGTEWEPQEFGESLSHVEPELARVVRRAMAPSPSDRYVSARDMLEALAELPRGDLNALLEGNRQSAAPVSVERAAIAPAGSESTSRNLRSEMPDGLADATTEDPVTGQKLAFVPPPPLHAVDAQLAASRAQAEAHPTTRLSDAPLAASNVDPRSGAPDTALDAPPEASSANAPSAATNDAVVDSPFRSRQSTAPGIHPDDAVSSASAARGPVSVPPVAIEPATLEASATSSQLLSERPPEAPATSVRRAGSTARATSSPTRAAKGTRAAPLTRSSPAGSPSTAPRARPKVELAAPATETPDVARPTSGRSRLPLVLSVLFLGLAVLGIVFFWLPGRNSGQAEMKRAGGIDANAKAVHAAAAEPVGIGPAQRTEGTTTISPASPTGSVGTSTNSTAATSTQSRDKSLVSAQPTQSKALSAKKQTSSSLPKKSPSVRSKDPYNYR